MRLHDFSIEEDTAVLNAISYRGRSFETLDNLTPFLSRIGRSRIVMLGEASHGTHEFYEWRRLISQHLIENFNFRFIAVEGDWPPAWNVNDFIHSRDSEQSSEVVLRGFNRWPTWMWYNRDVIDLVDWLRNYNYAAQPGSKAGFYGLDIYSIFESIEALLPELQRVNPFLSRKIRQRYSCFDRFKKDEKAYARYLIQNPKGCSEEASACYAELKRRHPALVNVIQNAKIVVNAENFYRVMVHGIDDSWNVRDRHMLDTLDDLLNYYGPHSKGIVWAHNTHIGDYRATTMAAEGLINIGGLVREKWGEDQVSLVGFSTYQGDVIASRAWSGPMEKLRVPPAIAGSLEEICHRATGVFRSNAFWLPLSDGGQEMKMLADARAHRAIGVVYHPEREHLGNYVPTSLSQRYDEFLFFDRTTALEPLDQEFNTHEFPETWPKGL